MGVGWSVNNQYRTRAAGSAAAVPRSSERGDAGQVEVAEIDRVNGDPSTAPAVSDVLEAIIRGAPSGRTDPAITRERCDGQVNPAPRASRAMGSPDSQQRTVERHAP